MRIWLGVFILINGWVVSQVFRVGADDTANLDELITFVEQCVDETGELYPFAESYEDCSSFMINFNETFVEWLEDKAVEFDFTDEDENWPYLDELDLYANETFSWDEDDDDIDLEVDVTPVFVLSSSSHASRPPPTTASTTSPTVSPTTSPTVSPTTSPTVGPTTSPPPTSSPTTSPPPPSSTGTSPPPPTVTIPTFSSSSSSSSSFNYSSSSSSSADNSFSSDVLPSQIVLPQQTTPTPTPTGSINGNTPPETVSTGGSGGSTKSSLLESDNDDAEVVVEADTVNTDDDHDDLFLQTNEDQSDSRQYHHHHHHRHSRRHKLASVYRDFRLQQEREEREQIHRHQSESNQGSDRGSDRGSPFDRVDKNDYRWTAATVPYAIVKTLTSAPGTGRPLRRLRNDVIPNLTKAIKKWEIATCVDFTKVKEDAKTDGVLFLSDAMPVEGQCVSRYYGMEPNKPSAIHLSGKAKNAIFELELNGDDSDIVVEVGRKTTPPLDVNDKLDAHTIEKAFWSVSQKRAIRVVKESTGVFTLSFTGANFKGHDVALSINSVDPTAIRSTVVPIKREDAGFQRYKLTLEGTGNIVFDFGYQRIPFKDISAGSRSDNLRKSFNTILGDGVVEVKTKNKKQRIEFVKEPWIGWNNAVMTQLSGPSIVITLYQDGFGSRKPSGCSTGAVLHELGHALGFQHTMQRADRDTWFTIEPEFLNDNQYKPNPNYAQNDIFPGSDKHITAVRALAGSVMMYKFGIQVKEFEGSTPAIIQSIQATLGSFKLSPLDAFDVNTYYSCVQFGTQGARGFGFAWLHPDQTVQQAMDKLSTINRIPTKELSATIVPNAIYSIAFSNVGGGTFALLYSGTNIKTDPIAFDAQTQQLVFNIQAMFDKLIPGGVYVHFAASDQQSLRQLVYVTFINSWGATPQVLTLTDNALTRKLNTAIPPIVVISAVQTGGLTTGQRATVLVGNDAKLSTFGLNSHGNMQITYYSKRDKSGCTVSLTQGSKKKSFVVHDWMLVSEVKALISDRLGWTVASLKQSGTLIGPDTATFGTNMCGLSIEVE